MQSPGAAAWSTAQAKAVFETTLSALTATITFAAASPPSRLVCTGLGGAIKRRLAVRVEKGALGGFQKWCLEMGKSMCGKGIGSI